MVDKQAVAPKLRATACLIDKSYLFLLIFTFSSVLVGGNQVDNN